MIDGGAGGVKHARLTQPGQHIALVPAMMNASHMRDISLEHQ
jgi:hypothetical protein